MIERLEAGWTISAVASAFGVDGRTVYKWRGAIEPKAVRERSGAPATIETGHVPAAAAGNEG